MTRSGKCPWINWGRSLFHGCGQRKTLDAFVRGVVLASPQKRALDRHRLGSLQSRNGGGTISTCNQAFLFGGGRRNAFCSPSPFAPRNEFSTADPLLVLRQKNEGKLFVKEIRSFSLCLVSAEDSSRNLFSSPHGRSARRAMGLVTIT